MSLAIDMRVYPMNSMNEKVLDIKAKIFEQSNLLIESVDKAFIEGLSAHKVEDNLLKQLLKVLLIILIKFLPA